MLCCMHRSRLAVLTSSQSVPRGFFFIYCAASSSERVITTHSTIAVVHTAQIYIYLYLWCLWYIISLSRRVNPIEWRREEEKQNEMRRETTSRCLSRSLAARDTHTQHTYTCYILLYWILALFWRSFCYRRSVFVVCQWIAARNSSS